MTTQPLLFLVGDDAVIHDQMKSELASDYQVLEAVDREAMSKIRQVMPPLVLLDMGLPSDTGGIPEGLEILRATLQLYPTTKVIVVMSNNDRANAIAAFESGAYDILEKPIRLEVLKLVLQRATYLSDLERESCALQQQSNGTQFEGLVGNSKPMQDVFGLIRRVGPSDFPVLITGESGTGKELVARAIHRLSARKESHFVAINCGAIPETLLESELFGYERGAFTGAVQQRKGRIESAQGGTLFLDEVGDIPLSLQVKLLRFLQDHEIYRLGGKEKVSIDARIIAATNIDLQEAIEAGRFREDLFYRLCVLTIPVSALKVRGSDITLLAKAFLEKFVEAQRKVLHGFTPQAIEALMVHSWPGNVRELENRVKRAVVMAEGKYITPADLELKAPSSVDRNSTTLRVARDLREKELVQSVLERAGGNLSKTALELGISRPTLYHLLSRYGLRLPKLID